MLNTIEKEYKYLVSSEQFKGLLSECHSKYLFEKYKIQANYYYDTENNTLNKAKTTVRIRQNHNDMKLQIKKHIDYNKDLATSKEHSEKINMLPLVCRIPGISDILQLKGVLVTERKSFVLNENTKIFFDINMYLGICDYEIEVEVDGNDCQNIPSIIESYNLIQLPIMSKSERFFKRLETMKNE